MPFERNLHITVFGTCKRTFDRFIRQNRHTARFARSNWNLLFHLTATCENFFAFILIISTIDYLASRVPGHPWTFFPVSDGLRTCWDSPKPLCTKLAFWLRVPAGHLSRITDSNILIIWKMKKARPGASAIFADTQAGVLNVPVPAAVSGQLHFPCAPPHREKRYFPVR